jgi:hypothetical protein
VILYWTHSKVDGKGGNSPTDTRLCNLISLLLFFFQNKEWWLKIEIWWLNAHILPNTNCKVWIYNLLHKFEARLMSCGGTPMCCGTLVYKGWQKSLEHRLGQLLQPWCESLSLYYHIFWSTNYVFLMLHKHSRLIGETKSRC